MFALWSFVAYDSTATQFVIRYQAKPARKSLGRGKAFNVISHVTKQAQHRGMTHPRNLEQISFQMGKCQLPNVKGGRASIYLFMT